MLDTQQSWFVAQQSWLPDIVSCPTFVESTN